MTFFKIRATGMPDWQGKMDYQLSRYGPASQREILSEWRAVNERNCAYMRAGCACGNGQVRIGLYGSHHWRSPWKEVRPNSTGVRATDNSGGAACSLQGALLGGLLRRAGVHPGSGPNGAPAVQDPQELHHLPVPTGLRAVCGEILP